LTIDANIYQKLFHSGLPEGHNPRDASAYNERGIAYKEKGQYDKAISDYNMAIEINPRLSEAYNNRGLAYSKGKGQYDKAISDYNKAIEIDTLCIPCYLNRGNAWDDKGNTNRAIADYNKAIELDPTFVGAYTERGVAYALTGDYQDAIRDFNKAIELDPNDARAYKSRGNTFFYQARFALAEADYETYLRIKPKDIYRILWLYLAQERGANSGLHRLSDNVNNVDLARWPGPVAYLFLERISPEELLVQTEDDDRRVKKERQCEAYFYLGQYYLLKNDKEKATQMFKLCLETKVTSFVEYTAAKFELERMGLE
jgi:lipoprotein NlpI